MFHSFSQLTEQQTVECFPILVRFFKMVGAKLIYFALLFAVIAVSGQEHRPDNHYYERFDKVDVIVDRIWPKGNPSETYSYTHLPFCPISTDAHVSQDLTADVTGSRKVKVNYNIRFLAGSDFSTLCTMQLTPSEAEKFREAIVKDFHLLFYIGTMI